MDKEPSSAWLWYLIGIWALFGVAFIMLGTGMARAQEQPLCAPAEILLRQFSEIHKERVIFEGVVPQDTGPVEIILMQGDKNTWSLFTIRGGIACLIAAGTDANPSLSDKGV